MGGLGGVLGPHHHPRRHRRRARGEELALPLDLDVTLPARPHRLQERVVAEPWDLDADLLGRPDDQGALGHRHLLAVDRQRDELVGHEAGTSSMSKGPVAVNVTAADSGGSVRPGPTPVTGQRPSRTCASYSSRKYLSVLAIGLTAPSASAQNALNSMLSPTSPT